jgi:ADP-ribose pyrophosphatase YjhB (NUDIX family)
MIIFINDIPVTILKTEEQPDPGRINNTIDAASESLTQAKFINHIWVKNASDKDFDFILGLLNSKVPLNVLSVIISVHNIGSVKSFLKSRFKIVKAAGGLIRKKEKFLMIYRLKKWDLPKGKKEKGERYRQTAVREVEEECNISVKIGSKLCTTWHTYTMNKKAMLKKTRWYVMDSTDDSHMKPALVEDIEEARWMSPKEVYHALEHSYKSISHVFEKYYAKIEVKSR